MEERRYGNIFYRTVRNWTQMSTAGAILHIEKKPKSAEEIRDEFGIMLDISQGEGDRIIVRAQPSEKIIKAHVAKNDEVGSIVTRAELRDIIPEGIVELTSKSEEHVTLRPLNAPFYESIVIYSTRAAE